MGAAAPEDPETEFYGAIGSSLFNYACFLLGRERVQIRVAVPGPLRRGCHALRLDVSREPRDECQRRVAAGSDSGRREEDGGAAAASGAGRAVSVDIVSILTEPTRSTARSQP